MQAWSELYGSAEERTYLNGPLVRTAAEWWDGNQKTVPEIQKILTIVTLEKGDFVGICGYFVLSGGEMEPYLILRKESSGQGLGPEVVSALVSVALYSLNAPGVRAIIDPKNERSLRVIKKLGFVFLEEYTDLSRVPWQDKHHVYYVDRSTYLAS
jgi:RimJ/RimL family protein N-acetyltransferase